MNYLTKLFIPRKFLFIPYINYLIVCILGAFLGFELAKNTSVILVIPAISLILLPFINIRFTVYSLVFLIPFEDVISMQRITLIRIWGIYVLVIYVARNIIENGSFGFKISMIHKFVLLLLPIMALSSFIGIDQKNSIYRSITVVQMIVFSILIYSTVKDKGRLDLTRLFFIACGIVTILQLLDYFNIINIPLSHSRIKSESRIQGFAGDPNRFGMTLLTAVYFGMAEIVLSRKILWKIIVGIIILLIIAGIVLSVSKGAIITLALSLFLFIIWQFYKKGSVRFPAIVILFFILLGLLYASKTQHSRIADAREYIELRFKNIERSTSLNVQSSRTATILAAAKATIRNPLGVGTGNFVLYSDKVHSTNIAAHNSIMEFAADLGIPGAICFLIIVFLLIRPILIKCDSHQCGIEKIIIFSFIAFFIQSLTLDIMRTKMLWFLVGLVAASGDYIRINSKNKHINDLRGKNESSYNFSSLS